jgi:hypothetical protein
MVLSNMADTNLYWFIIKAIYETAAVDSLSIGTIISIILSPFMGLLIGVLINYFADVLPESRRLIQPVCRRCSHPYSLKAYLLFRKCKNCREARSLRGYLVLGAAVLFSVLVRFFPFYTLGYWETLPVMLFLGVIIVIDIEHHIVLVQTSLVGIILFMIYGSLMHGFLKALYGGLAGLAVTLGFFLLGVVFTKFLGKLRGKSVNEVAFGLGDVFAGTFLGLLAGWPAIIGGIIAAILIFGAYSVIFLIVLLSSKKYRAFASAQPFTPFLILGVILIFYI